LDPSTQPRNGKTEDDAEVPPAGGVQEGQPPDSDSGSETASSGDGSEDETDGKGGDNICNGGNEHGEKGDYERRIPRGHRHEDRDAKKERKQAVKEAAREKRKQKMPKAEKKRSVQKTKRG